MLLNPLIWLMAFMLVAAESAIAVAPVAPPVPTPVAAPAQAPVAPPPDNEALARSSLEQLAARKFDDVARRFDPAMTEQLSPARLGEVWDQLVGQAGAFQAIERVASEQENDVDLVHVIGRFEKAELDFVFAFDKERRIAGLHAQPTDVSAGRGALLPGHVAPEVIQQIADWILAGGKTGANAGAGTLSAEHGFQFT